VRRLLLAGGIVLSLSGGAAWVAAQGPPLTVEVTVGRTSMTVTGAEGLPAGPTRFRFTVAEGAGERSFALFELKPGVTREEVERAAPQIREPADAHRYGRFVASGSEAGGEIYTTTLTLRDGEYVLIDFTRQGDVRASFRVGTEPSTAQTPEPDARIRMGDYWFRGAAVLPRRGIIRVENDGDRLHHALLFKLRRGVSGRSVVNMLRRGQEPRRVFAGGPSVLTEIVSPLAVNDVETTLRRGRHVLVCFISNSRRGKPHAALGMARAVRVR
jgi:hypothetical protein